MLRRMRTCFIAAGFALALFGTHAKAATVLALDFAGLVHASDYIVLANATAERSRYRDHDQLIVTDVTLRVARVLRGDVKAGASMTVTHLGGAVGDVGLSVPGEASFTLGQSAIVFLRRATRSDELHVVGMSQGVLRVTGTAGSEQVLPGGHDAGLVTLGTDGKLTSAPGAMTAPRALREVLAELGRLIAQDHAR